MKTGYTRLRKRDWYVQGGFSNPRLFRRMRGGVWHYYRLTYY
jgi:hypothetical protein